LNNNTGNGGKRKKSGNGTRKRNLMLFVGLLIVLCAAASADYGIFFKTPFPAPQNLLPSGFAAEDTPQPAEAPMSGEPVIADTPLPPASTPELSPAEEPSPAETPLNPEILALRRQYGNDDIIGYLNIQGTTIDYPVAQGADNDFYLTHNIDKNADAAGWIFLDYQNDIGGSDKNLIIYGHNMKKDYRFHALRNYASKSFFEAHPVITFDTLYGECQWRVFTFFVTDTSLNYIEVFPRDCDRYETLLDTVKSLSMYNTGADVTGDDQVLFLSTCVGVNDLRYVLGCVRIGQ